MTDAFDPLERRSPLDRQADIFAHAGATIRAARARIAFWRDRLPAPDDGSMTAAALSALPVLRKSDLPALQAALPPFGGLTDLAPGAFPRLFLSPGPIHEPGPRRADGWNVGRALFAAGLRAGDVVLNTFGYHLTPAGLLMDDAARSLGCAVIPAGGGNSEQVVQAMRAYRPVSYIGTADYLNILLGAADAAGVPVALRSAVVSGAAVPASLRASFAARGIEVFELYGTAELGIIAYETPSHDGLVLNEGLLVEIVAPGTGDPLPDGEVGELVVTPLHADCPLIRFATGDLSAILPGLSGCGRTNRRLRGWMGRADDAVKVKGMFIRPGLLAEIIAGGAGLVTRARFVIDRRDERDHLTLEAEGPMHDSAATDRLTRLVRDVTRLGSDVRWCADGSMPQGKLIEDRRRIELPGQG